MPEYNYNPMKGRNQLVVERQVELMNKCAAEGKYHLAIMYREMVWNCETFFGQFPEDARVYATFKHQGENPARSVATDSQSETSS